MTNEQYYDILTSYDSVIILGFLVLTLAISLTVPRIIKLMKQKGEFDSQRFEQEMQRHRLLIDVVKENTRVNSELKSALESYNEIIITTLKRDRDIFQASLTRIHEKLDLKDSQNKEILEMLHKIMLILERKEM